MICVVSACLGRELCDDHLLQLTEAVGLLILSPSWQHCKDAADWGRGYFYCRHRGNIVCALLTVFVVLPVAQC